MYLNGAILGMTKAEIDTKMEDIIEFSEVRDFIDTPVKRYSSGMYVKLAFSVAAHLDSEIMIMDEVLAVGDVNFQQKCLKRMREAAKQEGRTVLYVSHNMNTIRQLCDRCIVLSQGKVIYQGDVEEAIAIYSNAQQMELQSVVDLSNKKRNGVVTSNYSMQYVDISHTIVNKTQKLEFALKINAITDCDNIIVRLILITGTNGIIGMTYSNLIKVVKGENVVHLSMGVELLAPGDYVVDLALMEWKNQMQIRHDSVTKAFAFKVEEKIEIYNMRWNRAYFGATKLPQVKVNFVKQNLDNQLETEE